MQGPGNATSDDSVRHNLTVDSIDDSIFSARVGTLWREWSNLYGTSRPALPQKSQISMSALKTILPFLAISEIQSHNVIFVRLAGTGLEELAGRPLTGLNTLDLTPASQRSMVQRAYGNIIDFRCGLFICERIEFERGADADLQTLLLPLADKEGSARFSIGVYDVGASRFTADEAHRASTFRHKAFDQISYIDLGFGCPTP